MMKAAIDIGTNTLLLLVAEVKGHQVLMLHEEHRMPRLGKGVDADGNIKQESIDKVVEILKEYKSILEEEYPSCSDVVVTATSAVRDATNRDEFINQVFSKTGFSIILLSGDQEANYTYSGALSVFEEPFTKDTFVLDIGGGSTEIALGRKGEVVNFHSFDMGCVRFTERYLKHDPPFQEEIIQCREKIKELLQTHKFKPHKNSVAIGVAGTMTTLAAINLQLQSYVTEKINGHVVKQQELSKGVEIFSKHTHEQLLELSPNLMRGREDIFLAGLLILEEFMKFYKLKEIIVSTGGIRHGAIIKGNKS